MNGYPNVLFSNIQIPQQSLNTQPIATDQRLLDINTRQPSLPPPSQTHTLDQIKSAYNIHETQFTITPINQKSEPVPNKTQDVYYLNRYSESNPVSEIYFSFKNIQMVDARIRLNVYKATNKRIAPLGQQKLSENMLEVYKVYGNPMAVDPTAEVVKLNKIVVDSLTPQLISSVIDYYYNLIDLDNPNGVDFLSTPINMSQKGTKNMRSNADVLFGDVWQK